MVKKQTRSRKLAGKRINNSKKQLRNNNNRKKKVQVRKRIGKTNAYANYILKIEKYVTGQKETEINFF